MASGTTTPATTVAAPPASEHASAPMSTPAAAAPSTPAPPLQPAPSMQPAPVEPVAPPVAVVSPSAAQQTRTAKPPVASAPVAQRPAPTATPVPAPVASPPAKASAPPALDLTSLEQRLRDTRAIGLFTKLTIKNQVDDLLDRFRAFYKGKANTALPALRQQYEMLFIKVLTVVQDGDPSLASAIAYSREAIWSILSDPRKFAEI